MSNFAETPAVASAIPSLPCYPCPHNASCCAYGTTVSEQEAAAIAAVHGADVVYRTRWGEIRTRVRARRCVLLKDGACTIHDKPYYPSQCRGFPWTDGETGARYEYDVTICGAMAAASDLVQLQKSIGAELSP